MVVTRGMNRYQTAQPAPEAPKPALKSVPRSAI